MSFTVANFEYDNAWTFGNLFCSGEHAQIYQDKLWLAKSSDWRYFNRFAQNIIPKDIYKPLDEDDFYFIACSQKNSSVILAQTDIVGYEPAYIYSEKGKVILSDDILGLIRKLQSTGVNVSLSEKNIRYNILRLPVINNKENTIFSNIERLLPGSIITINVKDGKIFYTEYSNFQLTGDEHDPQRAATAVYVTLDRYFATHFDKQKTFGLGVSGGLDSRVAGYFAVKNGYKVHPYFIGRRTNCLGISTYDVMRGQEVADALNLGKLDFFDPRRLELKDKIANDAEHAPIDTCNVEQNCGYDSFKFDVLMHGMFGGEAFGAGITDEMNMMDAEQLSKEILYKYCSMPIYRKKASLIARVLKQVKGFSGLKKRIFCDTDIIEEVISTQQQKMLEQETTAWVREQYKAGLSNVNIWIKAFYYRAAHAVHTGYYSTLESTKPSLGCFLNPCFVRLLLSWDDVLFKNKSVQRELLHMLGSVGRIRSQSVTDNKVSIGSKMERIARGGAMVYPDWFDKSEIFDYINKNVNNTVIGHRINLRDNAWFWSGLNAVFALCKAAYLEKTYGLSVRG